MKYTIFIVITIFAVLLGAVIPLKGQAIWYPQYATWLFCLLAGCSLILWDFNKWLSIFTGVCLLSTFFVAKMYPRAIMMVITLDLACLVSYGISKLKNCRLIIWTVVALILIQSSWVLIQGLNKDFIFTSSQRPGKDEMVGFSGSADQLGTFYATTLPVALNVFPPLAVLSLTGIGISKSSFAFVAGIVAGLIYLFYRNRRWFEYAIVLCLIAGGVFFGKVDKIKSADLLARYDVWKHSIMSTWNESLNVQSRGVSKEIKGNRWIGYGFGHFNTYFHLVPEQENFNYVNEKYMHAHNDTVEVLFELGILGILALGCVVGGFIIDFIRSDKTKEVVTYFACIVAYILNAQGNFLSHIAVSGMLLCVFYGLYKGALNG